jgi:hypothetical protein
MGKFKVALLALGFMVSPAAADPYYQYNYKTWQPNAVWYRYTLPNGEQTNRYHADSMRYEYGYTLKGYRGQRGEGYISFNRSHSGGEWKQENYRERYYYED